MPMIIGVGPAPERDREDGDREEGEKEELEAVADILLEAIDTKNPKLVAKALHACYVLCNEEEENY